jgi:uroporphyrinogen decarboxylase
MRTPARRIPPMPRSLWEPDFDRMMTVLDRKGEPDRVPFFELFHDAQILAGVMDSPIPTDPAAWRQYRIDFMSRLGYDYVNGYHTFGFRGADALIADDTAEQSRGKRGWQDEHRGPIQDWESFEKYPWPRIEDADFSDIEALAPMLPGNMKVTTTLPGGVLENLSRLFGYEPLCYKLIDEPDLVQAVVDKIGEGELSVYRVLCDIDWVGAVWLNDDLGFKTQTMISPADLRKFVFPWHKRLVEYAHSKGKRVILHACGNLREVMEDLIEDVGIDAKHSFEDGIIPVADFKRQYGDRIAVIGGIDVHILASGTVDEVKAYTRKVIEDAAPGGGWALGSGNSVANYIPVPNFLAMLEAGREVGIYGG